MRTNYLTNSLLACFAASAIPTSPAPAQGGRQKTEIYFEPSTILALILSAKQSTATCWTQPAIPDLRSLSSTSDQSSSMNTISKAQQWE
jgi:hypothetical protein